MSLSRLCKLCEFSKYVGALSQLQTYHSRAGVYGHRPHHRTGEPLDDDTIARRVNNSNVYRLVEAYRNHGHRKASLDPLCLQEEQDPPELLPSRFGFTPESTENVDVTGIFYGGLSNHLSVSELLALLEKHYCDSIAAEFQHLQTEEEREWFAKAFEEKGNIQLPDSRKVDLAKLLLRAQAFDQFLASKFTTLKRYSGEGGESMMAVFDEIFRQSASSGLEELVICMPHRGRLNFLTGMLRFPSVRVFQKVSGVSEIPDDSKGTGDVVSHLYTSVDLKYEGKDIHVSLIPNPSHLEANNPVAVGKVRSKQQTLGEGHYNRADNMDTKVGDKVLCVQVHGDASFSAQGIISETFSIAECANYNIGGSVHLIVNNQIGFTTEAERGRSSLYSSDLAKINGYPILHVNADFPEDVVRATSIAMRYRERFRKDVIIDYICYRKHGHNELDDPSFTQPTMYNVIRNRKSIPDCYREKLQGEDVCSAEELEESAKAWIAELSDNYSQVSSHVVQKYDCGRQWSGYQQAPDTLTTWDTGVPIDLLKFIGVKSVTVRDNLSNYFNIPENIDLLHSTVSDHKRLMTSSIDQTETLKHVHPTIKKTHIERRKQKMADGEGLDWATAEALAFGSLQSQGFNVRISGQDVGRGTFSHRHAMLIDQQTDDMDIPLNSIFPEQTGFLEVANSALTEEAVLGFEYGMSIDHPKTLVIWEAQFGDFFNGAQSIIDTYVTSGENKWLLQSGLVMLLPHGMDGAGPEHSSCRIERFLQGCDSKEDGVDGDDVNIQIINPTTPAQYFHLLRRQMVRNYRKPLIVVAPKVLLRLPAASSCLKDMEPGTSFKPLLSDPEVKPDKVKKVVFCSGKHFYTMQKERAEHKVDDVALIRLESLCPFPTLDLQQEVKKFANAKEFIWSQEEHRNMGAWSFVAPRFYNLLGIQLNYVGRKVLGLPAVGIAKIHKEETEKLISDLFS